MTKRLPKMKSDRAAKAALKGDLSDYISPENFKSATFEFARKDKSITLRVSSELLNAVQSEAKRRRTNYQRLIREAIERFLTKAASPGAMACRQASSEPMHPRSSAYRVKMTKVAPG